MVFPLSIKKASKMVKEEQTAEVYLGSLRLFKTVSLDSPPKKEDDDEISNLWRFIVIDSKSYQFIVIHNNS